MSDPKKSSASPAKIALALGAAWFVGLTATLALLDGLLARMPMARALLGALVVTVAVERAGPRAEARQSFLGSTLPAFALGAAAFVIPLVAWALAGHADVRWVTPGTMLVVAVLVTLARAFETEMLLRVLTLDFSSRAALPVWAWLAFVTLASPAKAGFALPFALVPLLLSAALGLAAALVHLRGADARRNIAFTAGFTLFAGPLAQGGLCEIRWSEGELRPDALASGFPAILAAAVALAGAVIFHRRTRATSASTSP